MQQDASKMMFVILYPVCYSMSFYWGIESIDIERYERVLPPLLPLLLDPSCWGRLLNNLLL